MPLFGCDYICKTVQIMEVLGSLMTEFHNYPVNKKSVLSRVTQEYSSVSPQKINGKTWISFAKMHYVDKCLYGMPLLAVTLLTSQGSFMPRRINVVRVWIQRSQSCTINWWKWENINPNLQSCLRFLIVHYHLFSRYNPWRRISKFGCSLPIHGSRIQ